MFRQPSARKDLDNSNHTFYTANRFTLSQADIAPPKLVQQQSKPPDLNLAKHMQITKTAKTKKNMIKTLQRDCKLATQKMVQGAQNAKEKNRSFLFFAACAQPCCCLGLSSVQPHRAAAPSNAAWACAAASSGDASPSLPQSYILCTLCRWPPPAAS